MSFAIVLPLALVFTGCATSRKDSGGGFGDARKAAASFHVEGVALLEAGQWTEQALPVEEAARLDAAYAVSLAKLDAESVETAVLIPGKGLWTNGPAHAAAAYPWASVSKAVTAALIFDLAAEGKLQLADPARKYLPGSKLDPAITINHLLGHTSGLPTMGEPGSELALLFSPGRGWNYSNVGYQLLGEIVEQMTERSYAEVVSTRVAEPLGVGSLRAAESEELPSVNQNAAGSLIATAPDMLKFWYSLLSGSYLPKAEVRKMLDPLHPSPEKALWFGRGMMVYRVPRDEAEPRIWVGHSGGIPGHQAAVAWSEDARALAAVAIVGKGSPESVLNQLFKAIEE